MKLIFEKKALPFFCMLFLVQFTRAQSGEYLKIMNWMKLNNITINNPTPLNGYQMYRDCDANPVYKKMSGDTISFYTTTSWEAKTLEQTVQIEKRPYFNVTVFPLKVEKNGSFLMARMTPVTFLFKSDSLFLLDFSTSEDYGTTKSVEQMQNMVIKNVKNLKGDPISFSMDVANQFTDSVELQRFGKIGNPWSSDFPPDHVPLFYKEMFSKNRSVSFQKKLEFKNRKDSTVEKIELMKEWETGGEKYYFIQLVKNKAIPFFGAINQFIISQHGTFPSWENCRVDFKAVKNSVDSLNKILADKTSDSLYEIYKNAADNPGKKYGKAVATDEIARVSLYGRTGYIDKHGRDVIPVQYDLISSFHDGLAYVARNNKGGYINEKGEEIIPVKYDRVSNFNDGLAPVKIDNQWRVINKQGQELFTLSYDNVGNFNEGFALVYANNKVGIINTKGKEVVPVKYDRIFEPLHDGFFKTSLNDKVGFVDTAGRELASFQYEAADFFYEGLAGVQKNHKVGFIDKTGKEVIPLIYDLAFPFNQGVSIVALHGLYGLINKDGKELIPVKYDRINSIDTGLFSIKQDGLDGIMDKDGKTVMPFTYSTIYRFKNGYALVEKGYQKRGLIDKKGREIVLPKYNDLDAGFMDGMAAVHLNNKSGYVNKNGDEIIPIKYESAWSFNEGLAAVQLNKKWGFINQKNEVIIPFKYDLVNPFSKGLAAVSLNGKWGFIDIKGNLVIPCIYEQAESFMRLKL